MKEKSRYCLQKYLEQEFGKKGLLSSNGLSLFDLFRGIRREVQYNVTKVKFEENLSELYDKTEKFMKKAKSIIESRKK